MRQVSLEDKLKDGAFRWEKREVDSSNSYVFANSFENDVWVSAENGLHQFDSESTIKMRSVECEKFEKIAVSKRYVAAYAGSSVYMFKKDSDQVFKFARDHESSLNCVDIVGDTDEYSDAFIVSGSDDKMVGLWSIKEKRHMFFVAGHTNEVECVTAIDSEHFATGSRDDTARIWKLRPHMEPECLAVVKSHKNSVYAIGSLNSRFIFSGGYEHVIVVSDFNTTSEISKLEKHENTLRTIRAISDNVIVSSDEGDCMHVWANWGSDHSPNFVSTYKVTGVGPRIAPTVDGKVFFVSLGALQVLELK